MDSPQRQSGFTLAELLIALTILGLIATFTIPKILVSQQKQTYNVAEKEAIASVSSACQLYSLGTGASVNTWGTM